MREKIHTILILMLLSPALCQATIVAFYTDGVIQDGDVYDYVSVYNNAKVDMTGGTVTTQLKAYDSSTVNISGGVLHNTSTSYESSSTLNLSGNMQSDAVYIWDLGTLNMFDGTIGSVQNHSIANLYGGTISDYLLATARVGITCTVNIYGYGFEYNPLAGDYRGGQLTGFWMNDTPFSIDLYYSDTPGGPIIDTYAHIVLIPEPSTLLLLGLGVLMQRRLK
jgi:hypothetical protein